MANKLPDGRDLMMNAEFNKKLAKKAQDSIDSIYSNTYYSDNKDKQYIENIRDRMDKSINGLIDKTKLRTGDTNVSALYARTLAKGDTSLSVMKDITDSAMLSDILDLYSQNMVIRDMDREIDVILKYLPRLSQALTLIQQAVLASDHMNEDDAKISVLNTINQDKSGGEVDANDEDKVNSCKKKYNWKKLKKDLYEKTATYGEQYVYVLSYKKALSRVLAKNNGSNVVTEGVLNESTINEAISLSSEHLSFTYLEEGVSDDNASTLKNDLYEIKDITPEIASSLATEDAKFDLKVEINTSGAIPSIVAQETTLKRVFTETSCLFQEVKVKSDYGLAKNSSYLKNMDKEFKKFSKDSLKVPEELSNDGFTNKSSKSNNTSVEVPGCIVQLLNHEYVKPLYINNVCLGYYYIECDRPMDYDAQTTFSSTLGGLRPRRSTRDRENMDKSYLDNAVLRKIAKQISEKIDQKFINANQDLAEEIYTILKYNSEHNDGRISRIRISFIPPEDIVHSYFKLNEKTHRGVSDLEKSLFPAKLYSCLYISNTIALLTRGYDKRVYHVKQTVDTNITAVLLNVINQIKQSNFNLRQIENMNNILNITGRFNDLVIPQSANGESPVNMEVLPGQNIDVKTDFMNQLEEMAIEQVGVSIEMITNHFTNEQTATNVVQNNERFLIKVAERQELYAQILSSIFTKIYQTENDTNDILEVELPVPTSLRLTNTSQILASGNDVIQNIMNMKLGSNQDEELKMRYTGKLMEYYYSSILPMNKLDELLDKAKMEQMVDRNEPGGGAVPNPGGGAF